MGLAAPSDSSSPRPLVPDHVPVVAVPHDAHTPDPVPRDPDRETPSRPSPTCPRSRERAPRSSTRRRPTQRLRSKSSNALAAPSPAQSVAGSNSSATRPSPARHANDAVAHPYVPMAVSQRDRALGEHISFPTRSDARGARVWISPALSPGASFAERGQRAPAPGALQSHDSGGPGHHLVAPIAGNHADVASRFILADTDRLHTKITTMSDRIRQLEDALAILQSSVSRDTHPLLRRDLLDIKSSLTLHSATNAKPQIDNEEVQEEEGTYIDAFGTLAVRDDGAATFYGRSAGTEVSKIAFHSICSV